MPVGDVSRFSQVEAVLWDALQEGSSTPGANLQAWRLEQDPAGASSGRDYEVGEIPTLEEIPASACPALVVLSLGAIPSEELIPDSELVLYRLSVVGVIQDGQRDRETYLRDKVRKFGELVWTTLVQRRSDCFGALFTAAFPTSSWPNPIQSVALGPLTFPDFEKPSTAVFSLEVTFSVELPVR